MLRRGAPSDPPPARVRLLPTLGATLLAIAFLVVMHASQIVMTGANFGHEISWIAALSNGAADHWPWLLLVPAIFAVCHRFPLNRPPLPLHAAIHLGFALVTATIYMILQTATTEWLVPDHLQLRLGRGMGAGRGSMEARPKPPSPLPPPPDGATNLVAEVLLAPLPPAGPPPGGPGLRGPGPGGGGPGGPGGPGGRDRRPPLTFMEKVQVGGAFRWYYLLLSYVVATGSWHWVAQRQTLRERERGAQELSRQLAEARLQALRMQLNPHFLFNTLNAIATLVHRDARAADEMIACLSDFLRLTLSASNSTECALHKELEFARRYLDIERARFGERLATVEEISLDCLPVLVPTLLLQPLLENAVRHGIERCEGRGEIRLGARREGDTLVLTVADTGPGLAGTPPNSPSGRTGIGLSNTRARLHELHGAAGELQLRDRPGGGLLVEVRIPWRTAA